MKILVTLTYYHPHWTGLTVIAQHLAEGLAARPRRHRPGVTARPGPPEA